MLKGKDIFRDKTFGEFGEVGVDNEMSHIVAHAAGIGICPKGLVIRGTEGMCPVTDASGTSD